MELAIGQRLRKGAIGVWHEVSPYLGGIGISSAIVSFIVALYYVSNSLKLFLNRFLIILHFTEYDHCLVSYLFLA